MMLQVSTVASIFGFSLAFSVDDKLPTSLAVSITKQKLSIADLKLSKLAITQFDITDNNNEFGFVSQESSPSCPFFPCLFLSLLTVYILFALR